MNPTFPISPSTSRFANFATRRATTLIALAAVAISACTATTEAGVLSNDDAGLSAAAPPSASTTPTSTTAAPSTSTSTSTTIAPTTTAAPSTTAASTTTTAPSTSTTSTTTTTTTTTTVPVPLDVFDPDCVVRPDEAASMERLAGELDADLDPVDLWAENGFVDAAAAGDLVDTCVGNGVNDIDGTPNPALDGPAMSTALASNIARQQTKLNELFGDLGTGDLVVDGVSGPRTGQALCAARLALGIDTTIADMAPGTDEQVALFGAAALPTPKSTATESERWVLIDRTCQMMFIGSGDDTTFLFPTSTGSEGFETREQDRAPVFRFNPALDNGGWHNSSEYPVGVDNPLNGNLYKPMFFDSGQAIHGANNVPPTPASKGCARLRVGDQEALLSWLGLDDVEGELWRQEEMNVTVNVQGSFVPRPTPGAE